MTHPLLEIEAVAIPYWEGLEQGELRFQRCMDCNHTQLPPRMHCTHCLSPKLSWEKSAGQGELISWVVYHIAYHKFFEGRTPYNVALVKLDEGPNLITNLVHVDVKSLRIGLRATLAVEQDEGQHLARFRIAPAAETDS